MLSWDMAMAMVLRRVRPPHLYQRRNTKPAVCLISHVGRGRFFESRVTGGASGRNTGSLKSWRDGPLSEQRSISQRCIRFDSIFEMRALCDTAEIEMVDTRTRCRRHDTHVHRVVVIVPCSDLRGYDMRAMSSHGIQCVYRPFRVPRSRIYIRCLLYTSDAADEL